MWEKSITAGVDQNCVPRVKAFVFQYITTYICINLGLSLGRD